MTRIYGWAASSHRVVEKVPYGHWKTTTLLAALTLDGVKAPLVIDGCINGELFLAWIRKDLVTTLRPGQVVVMDNLSSHKVSGVREAIESAGCKLMFLPPYSPDFNPIEQIFAWFKTKLRAAKQRTREMLWATIGSLCDELAVSAIANTFSHCGYPAGQAA